MSVEFAAMAVVAADGGDDNDGDDLSPAAVGGGFGLRCCRRRFQASGFCAELAPLEARADLARGRRRRHSGDAGRTWWPARSSVSLAPHTHTHTHTHTQRHVRGGRAAFPFGSPEIVFVKGDCFHLPHAHKQTQRHAHAQVNARGSVRDGADEFGRENVGGLLVLVAC